MPEIGFDLDLDAWLREHHARFPRDKSCTGVPLGGGPIATLCRCQKELRLPDTDALFLSCSRQHEDPAYGWSTNTVLYAVEGGVLRAVLDIPSGMSGNNFEMIVPAIMFVPQVRGNAIVFVEKAVDVFLAVDLVAMTMNDAYDAAYLLTAEW